MIPQSKQPDSLDSVDLEKGDSSRVTLPDSAAQGTRELSRGRRESAGKEGQEGQEELRAHESFLGDSHLSRAGTAATRRSEGTTLGVSLTGINMRDRTTNEGKGGD
jgi:hypothetical protein